MKSQSTKDLWDARYKSETFIYGKEANQYFKEALKKLNLTGKILLAAEGEGRNAIYAAKKGLDIFAFDISEQARNKALQFAKEENVQIRYEVGEISNLGLEEDTFDAAAMTFAHLPAQLRRNFHREVAKCIKPGGFIILQGFSKKNLENKRKNPNAGGPNKEEMLFSEEIIRDDFQGFEMIELEEAQVNLNEGVLHNGTASVINFIGRKL